MNKNLTLGISIGTFIIAAIGLYFGYQAMTATIADPVTNVPSPDPDAVNAALVFANFAIIVGLGAWVLFSIWGIIQKPKSFIPTAIGVVLFVIIAFIGYSMANAGSAEVGTWIVKKGATDGGIMWSNAGLIISYIVLIIAIVAIFGGIVMGLLRYFKK